MRQDISAITLENTDVTGGFWYEKQKLVREVSLLNVYKRFSETGRFEAFNFTWHDGEKNKPHVFWDSDVAKWIEAVAYVCEKERSPKLENIVDGVVDAIEKNRMSDGYFNSYFGHLEPKNRFTRRKDHELYCLGHLIEAAIAYKRATGKGKLLDLMIDYTNLIYKVFYVEKSAGFITPGHEEIELALVKLYRETGDRKYLELALYFINARGVSPENDGVLPSEAEAAQDHLPVRKQRKAVGHAVRACYLYSAMADLARETGDEELFTAAKAVFNNIVKRRMYVTGAIGQTAINEAFAEDFDLPNQTAYAETCANLSLALFARRMSLIEVNSIYADTVEKVLYNSFISGMSLDGRSFFYSNLQENDLNVRRRKYGDRHRIFCPDDIRVEVFNCSCCPPNVVRTVASIQDFAYTTDAQTLFVHQYLSSEVDLETKHMSVKTDYPFDEKVEIVYTGADGRIALRIPGWCEDYEILKNGAPATNEISYGYAYLPVSNGDKISLCIKMPTRFIESHPRVWENAGRVAVARGPVIYCIEGVDNPYSINDIRLDANVDFDTVYDETMGVQKLVTTGYIRNWADESLYSTKSELIPVPVQLIPYFAFANRGETDMVIWTLKK